MLYTAGMDDRKNFQGLFRAWGRLPAAVRDGLAARDGVRHRRADAQPPRASRRANRASRRACSLPGLRPRRACLRLLYQSTDLFVFPSLYEGFGLPVAEALACGARVIGSATSAVAELLVAGRAVRSRRRRCDGSRDRACAHRTTRCERCSTSSRGVPLPRWDAVADRTADAYEQLLGRSAAAGAASAPRRGRHAAASGRERRRRLQLPAARRRCASTATCTRSPTVCRHVDPELGPPRAPDGVEVLPVRHLVDHERARGGYDCCRLLHRQQPVPRRRARPAPAPLGNRARARSAADRPLRVGAADEPDAVPAVFWRTACTRCTPVCRRASAPPVGSRADEAERIGVLMAAEIVALADRFVVMSEFAADRVRLDVGRRARRRASACVPFAVPDAGRRARRRPRRACRSSRASVS